MRSLALLGLSIVPNPSIVFSSVDVDTLTMLLYVGPASEWFLWYHVYSCVSVLGSTERDSA